MRPEIQTEVLRLAREIADMINEVRLDIADLKGRVGRVESAMKRINDELARAVDETKRFDLRPAYAGQQFDPMVEQ